MTQVPIFGGALKRDLVQLAYEECGQADYSYTIQTDEYDSALRRLNVLMAEWAGVGIDLGYNFPDYGNGSPEDESGIPIEASQVVGLHLAARIAPTMGKTLSGETRAQMAVSLANLRAMYLTAPSMSLSRQTVRGAGNRWGTWNRDPYYRNCRETIVKGYPPAEPES